MLWLAASSHMARMLSSTISIVSGPVLRAMSLVPASRINAAGLEVDHIRMHAHDHLQVVCPLMPRFT